MYLYIPGMFDPSGINDLGMLSSAPMRMLEYGVSYPFFGPPQMSMGPPGILPSYFFSLIQPYAAFSPASWTWQIGAPSPAPAIIYIEGGFPFTVVSSVPWVSVSPTQGSGAIGAWILTPETSLLSAAVRTLVS